MLNTTKFTKIMQGQGVVRMIKDFWTVDEFDADENTLIDTLIDET